ncbi:MAG TPA: hypothetical protein VGO16_13830 [Pseudonocardiaceae bacterium]|jgi:hypothetical protein|nr:hypothetical protein [Pseudonocardiaceae bacterium]
MPGDPPDYFVPETGVVLSHPLIVRDVDRSREFYHRVLGAVVCYLIEVGKGTGILEQMGRRSRGVAGVG